MGVGGFLHDELSSGDGEDVEIRGLAERRKVTHNVLRTTVHPRRCLFTCHVVLRPIRWGGFSFFSTFIMGRLCSKFYENKNTPIDTIVYAKLVSFVTFSTAIRIC